MKEADMGKITKKRWVKVCTVFFLVLVPLFLGGCGGGSNDPTFNITGKKNVFQTTTGSTEVALGVFTFAQSGSTLTGTTAQGQAITGTVSGTDVTFTFVGADLAAVYTYGGTVHGGGIMSGTWTATNGQSGTWRTTLAA
jgi:hypothetical protein